MKTIGRDTKGLSTYIYIKPQFYMSKTYLKILVALLSTFAFSALHSSTWIISPSGPYFYCSEISDLVSNGDSILIEAATYVNDVQVSWNQDDLFIAGIGGRPRLEAGSNIANDMTNGKGIFVVAGDGIHIHNIEFANATVVDHNGAGIRQEGKNLLVTSCRFVSNEMGILCGNIDECKTTIEYSEFLNGGSAANPGYQHNVYINHIDTLIFRYNYSHDAIAEGHELKSRARNNIIMYNRIANENSMDSRSIDLPNGGTTIIVGNVIEQGVNSANSNLLGYALEGATNSGIHALYIVNNTFINKKSTGSFIHVGSGTELLYVKNNILAGSATGGLIIGEPLSLDSANNIFSSSIPSLQFIDPELYDYHLTSESPSINAGTQILTNALNLSLIPSLEYADTCSFIERVADETLDCGAFELTGSSFTPDISSGKNNVFPNPNQGRFTYHSSLTEKGKLTLYNSTGQIIWEGEAYPGNNQIEFSTNANGVYTLTIVGEHHHYWELIVVEN
ncbi:MAG: T9SS type A sorting domain-containing protein [Flavobacteriales bacterium]|nr:T9SS type A sorting domain-containing protein [Flavobacteriales bacterium]